MNRPKAARRTPPAASSGSAPFWRITNKAGAAGAPAEMMIYDEISFYGVTAQDFAKDLGSITAPTLTVRLNSPGGDVFDGLAIANLLRDHPAQVTVKVDALAASIASVIAMAGDEVIMGRNAQMMVHDASGGCFGNATEMLDMAALLDMISDNIADAYADRAGGEAGDWRKTMKAETWYTAEEAVAAGLADSVAAKPERDEKAAEKAAARWVAEWGLRLGHDAPAPVVERIAASLAVEADAEVPEPTALATYIAEQTARADTEALRAEIADLRAELATARAVAPVEPVTANETPVAIDVNAFRLAFQAFAGNVPATPAPVRAQVVDLGPAPAPVVEPEPVVNTLADTIRAATHLARTSQPEPHDPAAPQHDDTTPTPPFALDVSGLRRAVREARF